MVDNPFQDLLDKEEAPSSTSTTGNPFQNLLDKEQTPSSTSTTGNPFQNLLGSKEVNVTVDDPDSFTSRLGRSFNNFQKSFAEGVGVYGRQSGNEALENWSRESITNQQKDIDSYGTPTRTSSLTKGIDNISEADDLAEGISRSALLAKDMLADALGSVGIPLVAGLAAVPVAAVAGPTVGLLTGLLAPFIAGGIAGAGEVKEEALKLGATPEEADKYGAYGGVVMGVLEKVGSGYAVKSIVKEFGKDALIKEASKELGEKTSKTAVDKALKFSGKAVKATAKGGIGESITEAAQEAAQISLAGLAADKGIAPYKGVEISNRLIDAAALGFIGGKAINVGGSVLSKASSKQANDRQEEIQDELKRAEETLFNSKTELYKPLSEGKTGNTDKFTNIVRRSTTPLVDFANRDTRANSILSKFNSFYDDSSSDIGKFSELNRNAFDKVKRTLKVPVIQKDISKKKMNDLYYAVTNRDVIPKDKKTYESSEIIRNDILGTKEDQTRGLYGQLVRAGLVKGFEKGYLPRVYDMGFGNKKLGKVFNTKSKKAEKIFKKYGASQVQVDEFLDNVIDNDGMYVNEEAVSLNNPMEASQTVPNKKQSFEMSRKLTDPRIIKELEDADIIVKDVRKLVNTYTLQASRRIRAKELKDEFDSVIPELIKEGKVTNDEIRQMQDIYSSIQNSYRPIRSKSWRDFNKFNLTYQYMLTLPTAAITSLTEPFFVLSRVSPKNAIFAGMDTAITTMRKGLRTVAPKLPRSEKEKAFDSILQGFDASLSERLSNIAGIDVPRRFSDIFFKTILLTQITQLSRNVAFQAGQRSMKEDILELHKAEQSGEPTRGSQKAQLRLLEMGLVKPTQTEVMEWVNGKRKMPEVIRKSMSKFVDEIIMSPNAVNRPLWAANPHLGFISQLKGFTLTIGNTIAYRMYKELVKPLYKGRIPVEEAFRYSLAFSLIVAGTLGTKALKDFIRYDDNEDSYWNQKSSREKIFSAIVDSNIFGPGTLLHGAFEAQNFGTGFIESLMGPSVNWVSGLTKSLFQYLQGRPKSLAKTITKSIPILNQVAGDTKQDMIDTLEDTLEDSSDSISDFKEDLVEG